MAEPVFLEGVTKNYGRRCVLQSVSVSVDAGSLFVLLGPSGSGKTTLVRCVAGLERIDSGYIAIGERVVAAGRRHVPPEERGVAMVFQDYALWPHMTTLENVMFPLRQRKVGHSQARQRGLELLERVGVAHLSDHYPAELSGGEQQRVGLARALGAGSPVLICDEPLSNLDAALRDRMRLEISRLVREEAVTTLYITHDQAEAFALADVVGIMDSGKLLQVGAPEALYMEPRSRFVARFTGLAGELEVLVLREVGPDRVQVQPRSGGGSGYLEARVIGRMVGKEGVLFIRPGAVSLADPGSQDAALVGRVVDCAFRAGGYEHVVELPGGERLVGVTARRRFARGEIVGMSFEAAGCVILPAATDGSHSQSLEPSVAAVAGAKYAK